MTHAYRKVRPGEPFKLSAAVYNKLVDQVITHQEFVGVEDAFPRANLTLRCKNFTTGPMAAGDVLQVDTLLEVPTGVTGAAESTFWQWPGVVGLVPGLASTTMASYAVFVEPVPAGAIGLAAVDGVVQSRVVRRCTGHQYAKPVTGKCNYMESADTGPFRIVAIAPTGPVPTGATGPGAPAALLMFSADRTASDIPGHSTGSTQLLGHGKGSTGASGCDTGLQWYSVTECSGNPSYASSYFL
jgi:hypothetical protein